jgi:hypothetical protein
MGWMVRRYDPGGGRRFFVPVQTGLWAHPATYTKSTESFLGVKWKRVVLTSTPFRAKVKERVQIYLYSSLSLSLSLSLCFHRMLLDDLYLYFHLGGTNL